MSSDVETGEITTKVPARLDRLPWSKFHWRIVIGLGSVWILDGLEVTMVGSVASRLTEKNSGIDISVAQIGTAASIYIVGACLGALFFGQLTDRFGRKKLFMLTLGVYIAATVATAFSFAPWYLFAARFLTGAGIGGEYAAINSAIDELIPARARGRVDLSINGSYWVGSAAGSAAALFLLNEAIFPANIGWRLAFAVGAALGLLILVVRRNVPESPRWLFIHGREDEAERIVGDIESDVADTTGQDLSEPEGELTVRQRKNIPFREIAKVAFKAYPKRAFLGLALFVGQAFIYNGVTFNLGTLYSTFFDVSSGFVPVMIIIWALGNFAGPVTLGRMFDSVGRKPMITGTYLSSAVVAVGLAWYLVSGGENKWVFEAILVVCFFLASAGASAAYLTVSEIFPMETRALAIAFFYAIGTAVGGVSGPLIFSRLISSQNRSEVAIAFLIGAGVMAIGGFAELFLGVAAENQQLEDIAQPLTSSDVDDDDEGDGDGGDGGDAGGSRDDSSGGSSQERPGATRQKERERTRADEQRSRDERIHARAQRRQQGGRYRPGPGRGGPSSLWLSPPPPDADELALDREIETIGKAVDEQGELSVSELAQRVGGRYWGPGRFHRALREAMVEGRVQRVGRDRVRSVDDRHDAS